MDCIGFGAIMGYAVVTQACGGVNTTVHQISSAILAASVTVAGFLNRTSCLIRSCKLQIKLCSNSGSLAFGMDSAVASNAVMYAYFEHVCCNVLSLSQAFQPLFIMANYCNRAFFKVYVFSGNASRVSLCSNSVPLQYSIMQQG